jgi:hypothetical protein
MSHTTITAGLVAPAVVPVADAAIIAVDAALGNDFRVTIAGNRTVANPTGAVDGQRITFQVTQGGTGGCTLTWSSQFRFGAAGAPTLSAAVGDTDVIGYIYNASLNSWLCVGAALGFPAA